ncbi:hypothetical protein LCGC14_2988360, partial [marine sediment metagenome]
IEVVDGDTKIQTEESADEDKIRFDTGGTERAILDSSGLQLAVAAASPPQANTLVKGNIIKGWVNFAGSSTINASFNVASITDNATSDFTIVIDQNMADTNYVVIGMVKQPSTSTQTTSVQIKTGTSLGVGSFNIITLESTNTLDSDPTMVIIMGNQ